MFHKLRQWVGLSRQEVRDHEFIAGRDFAENAYAKYPIAMAHELVVKEASKGNLDSYYNKGLLDYMEYYKKLQKGQVK